MDQHNLTTLSQVMNVLRERGVTKEVRMNDNKQMVLQGTEIVYQPGDLTIVRFYRFEGDSSADDNAVLYLVEDTNKTRAIIIDSYGAESNYDGPEFDEFIKNVKVHELPDREIYGG